MAVKTKKRKVAKKRSARPTAARKAAAGGYKGHREGSRIGQLHEVFDSKGADAAREYGRKKLKLSDGTINTQLSHFANA